MSKIDKVKSFVKKYPFEITLAGAAVTTCVAIQITYKNHLKGFEDRAIETHEHQIMIMNTLIRQLTDNSTITAHSTR